MLGQTATWVDVSPARAPDIPALVKLLRQQAAVLPAGEPLRGYGYNHRALPERRHPTAADLDLAATDREIYVMNQSGHGGVLNSAGLARCGITAATPDIPGGHIGRYPGGRPDGLVMDAACDLLTGDGGVKLGPHGPNLHLPPGPGEAARWLADAQRAFLAAGVTSLVDAAGRDRREDLRGRHPRRLDGLVPVRLPRGGRQHRSAVPHAGRTGRHHRAAGTADRVGSLEPGKLADLTVLDGDPADAEQLASVRVAQTWVGGTLRYQRT
mgnify:CR=1 FL=1